MHVMGIRPEEIKEPLVRPRLSDYKAALARIEALGAAAQNWCQNANEEKRKRRSERGAWGLVVFFLFCIVLGFVWRMVWP